MVFLGHEELVVEHCEGVKSSRLEGLSLYLHLAATLTAPQGPFVPSTVWVVLLGTWLALQ